MKRFVIWLIVMSLTTAAVGQKVDASFVLGAASASDIQQTFTPTIGPSVLEKTSFDRHIFLEGAASLRLLNAHAVSLRLEVPVAEIPSQPIAILPGESPLALSALFITPGLRVNVLPGAAVSPWGSVGGGWAHYSSDNTTISKGALQYGGGLDFKTGLPLLAFRAEVRDFVTADPVDVFINSETTSMKGLHHHNVLVGGGIVLRF
ncbi:MAG TPA: hypothetical protein VFR24_03965 [Candidatus Angelobacter sp.]|nr:hypothetical protein [Candidatus Angelobacter sp.]